ncbi:MAG: hypothetical protein AAB794_01695 [Patescibacteria group bacterium]
MSQTSAESRESWVAVGADGEEHLFVHCGSCNQPYESSRKVLRVSEEDYAKLERLNSLATEEAINGSSVIAALFLLTFVELFCVLELFSDLKVQLMISGGTILLLVMLLCWSRVCSQQQEKKWQQKEEILFRYGAKIEDNYLTLPPKSEYD